ncbi:MAG: ribosome-associated protein [Cognaticolwellia sp.]|jgi:ribosome-associated protein
MARKKNHQWAREDQPVEGVSVNERVYDHEHQAARKRFQDLADLLIALSPGARALLPLDETIQEEINIYLRQGPKSSRRRQLLRVQTLLRTCDLESLDIALESDLQGGQEAQNGPKSWLATLLEGDDAVLMDFVELHPDADRQQLRTLVRRAKPTNPAGLRAKDKLLAALMELKH